MESDSVGWQIFVIIILVFINAFFSLAEVTIINVRKTKMDVLEKENLDDKGMPIKNFNNTSKLFSTTQIGITIVSLLTGIYAGEGLAKPLAIYLEQFEIIRPYAKSLSLILIILIISYLLIVFSESFPKRLARLYPEKMILLVLPIMNVIAKIFTPVIWLSTKTTEALMFILGLKTKEEPKQVTEEEIKDLLLEGVSQGVFQKEEPQLIDRVFKFADLAVNDIMTPRTQIEWIDLDEPEKVMEILKETSHRRLPVGIESLDACEGFVSVKEFFHNYYKNENNIQQKNVIEIVKESLQKPVCISEALNLMRLLEIFKKNGVHEAIVLDEFGGFSGVVTLRDVLEEILGLMPEGQEEMVEDFNKIIKKSETEWLIDGMFDVEEFEEYFKLEEALPGSEEGMYKTLAGFLTYLFGKIPKQGEKISWQDFEFEIKSLENFRIDKIVVRKGKETS